MAGSSRVLVIQSVLIPIFLIWYWLVLSQFVHFRKIGSVIVFMFYLIMYLFTSLMSTWSLWRASTVMSRYDGPESNAPQRSNNCIKCGTRTLNYQFHSDFLGNCVGLKNVKYLCLYWVYLLYGSLFLLFTIALHERNAMLHLSKHIGITGIIPISVYNGSLYVKVSSLSVCLWTKI